MFNRRVLVLPVLSTEILLDNPFASKSCFFRQKWPKIAIFSDELLTPEPHAVSGPSVLHLKWRKGERSEQPGENP